MEKKDHLKHKYFWMGICFIFGTSIVLFAFADTNKLMKFSGIVLLGLGVLTTLFKVLSIKKRRLSIKWKEIFHFEYSEEE
ncbi:hypothetical protein [uncultured Chryseobacterium sp.]|jgi:uncharacterized membrane protein YhaH (DUF805 family)|uniref:hypothetical protein n=1 Tax=uncultured Chryseobacterium sp. TaxID=259322 RepID=UPI00258AFCCA|nr:hypothetical protein [uncultured Chryseobacterium sp.]